MFLEKNLGWFKDLVLSVLKVNYKGDEDDEDDLDKNVPATDLPTFTLLVDALTAIASSPSSEGRSLPEPLVVFSQSSAVQICWRQITWIIGYDIASRLHSASSSVPAYCELPLRRAEFAEHTWRTIIEHPNYPLPLEM